MVQDFTEVSELILKANSAKPDKFEDATKYTIQGRAVLKASKDMLRSLKKLANEIRRYRRANAMPSATGCNPVSHRLKSLEKRTDQLYITIVASDPNLNDFPNVR